MHWAVLLTNKLFWVISTAFWIWMLVDCVMNEPDRFMWLWIIFIFHAIGALAYFVARKMPVLQYRSMPFLSRLTLAGRISSAEADVYNIGNAHQYIVLGELLLDTGRFSRAGEAFSKALEKDPEDIQALWGSAQVDMKKKQFSDALPKLEKVVKLDYGYKYGDAALKYCRALYELKQAAKAKKELEKYLQKWSPPEASYMMASLLADEGRKQEAYAILNNTVQEMKGAPAYYRSRNTSWMWAIRILMAKVKP